MKQSENLGNEENWGADWRAHFVTNCRCEAFCLFDKLTLLLPLHPQNFWPDVFGHIIEENNDGRRSKVSLLLRLDLEEPILYIARARLLALCAALTALHLLLWKNHFVDLLLIWYRTFALIPNNLCNWHILINLLNFINDHLCVAIFFSKPLHIDAGKESLILVKLLVFIVL